MEYFKTEFSFILSELTSLIPEEGGLALLLIIVTILMIYAGSSIAFSLFGTAALFAAVSLVSGGIYGNVFPPFAPEIEAIFLSPVLIAVPLLLFTALMIERAFVVENLIEKFINHWKQKSEAMLFTVSLIDILISILAATICLLLAPLGALRLPLLLKAKNHVLLNKESIQTFFQTGPMRQASFMSLPVMIILVAGQLTKMSLEINNLSVGKATSSKDLLSTLTATDLIIAALVPGILLVGLYGLFQLALLFKNPNHYAYKKAETKQSVNPSSTKELFIALLPAALYILVLISAVLFIKLSITEITSLAAIGAIFLASQKLAPQKNNIYLNSVISFLGLATVSQFFPLNITSFKLTPWNGAGLAIAIFFISYLAYGLYHAIKELYLVHPKSESNNKHIVEQSFLEEILREAYEHSVKLITLLIAASFYLIVFKALGGDNLVKAGLESFAELNGFVLVLSLFTIMLTAKFFSPYIALLVAMPILMPHMFTLTNIQATNFNFLWLGIIIVISLQIIIYSFLVPEKEKAQDANLTLQEQIHQTKIPFIAFHVLILALICLFPGMVNWLSTVN
ncbi:MAG: hypothetical protein JJ964_08855 [Rhizobiales bacterium]|nr:hypothetical protein [Hyphomicrobiales bacterium]